MEKYQPTIGLEIHAELKTATKMFCDCSNDPLERRPNVNVCPVCLAHPGTLPVPNKKAIEAVIKVGLALGGDVAPVSKFDRKNYFYPDLPKGYQISQYDQPIISGGKLHNVRIRRIHLEEDTGRLQHATSDMGQGTSLVDFNRAGVPLMELVTEPDVRSAEEAVRFAKELQLILRYLGVSDADMEKGQMRVEANISLDMGTKVEVKNLNSFRAVGDAIEYETKRQRELLEKAEKIVQETRGWDEARRRTVHQRLKEEAHDYRYFPEPDIPPFESAAFGVEEIRRTMPELPSAKRERFGREYGLSGAQADLLVSDPPAARFFEEAVSELESETKEKPIGALFNYLTSDLRGYMNETGTPFEELKIDPENFADLVILVAGEKIGSRQAKDILRKMCEEGGDPKEIVEREGFHTVSDAGELEKVVDEIIAANAEAVSNYKKGKTAALQFLVGQAMGKLRGRGNPDALRDIFLGKLKGES
jgi:aspartyl-tRNA(Asn)/glutamyl-tRNA(Gln) amidotransferase subunit B